MNKEAPKGWEFVPADKYCTEVTDGTHDSPKPVEYNGHYLLTSKNVTSGILNYENAYCISEEDFNAVNKRSKVNQYDLLYSMIGTVGESCIVEQDKIDRKIFEGCKPKVYCIRSIEEIPNTYSFYHSRTTRNCSSFGYNE